MKNRSIINTLVFCACAFFPLQNLLAQGSSGIKPEYIFFRHNSGPNGTTPILSGDTIGTLFFKGFTALKTAPTAATIRSVSSGIVGPSSLRGNLIFSTAGATLAERMVITPEGLVGIGTMTPEFQLHTIGNTHTTGDFYGRIHFDNNQSTDDAPNTYHNEAYFELKQRATLGVPGAFGTYGGLLSLAPGITSNDHQMFFGDDGIYHRRFGANAPSWAGSTWYKLLTGEDINGTVNYVSKFTAPNKLGDSQIFDDGTSVGIATNLPATTLDVRGTFNASQAATFGTTVNVSGNTTIGGNVSAAQALTVAGNSQLSNTSVTGLLTVNGNSQLSNTSVTGLLTVNGNAAINGDAVVTSNSQVNGNSAVNGNSTVNGNATVGTNLQVNGTGRVNGKFAIGTSSTPGGHLLYVGGSILAEEVKVALQGSWPDYVFTQPTPNPLDWERYIAANQHLPGIPSAQEVEQNGGFNVGDTQRLLLEKVEQLTLMLIAQQKEIDALKAQVQSNTGAGEKK